MKKLLIPALIVVLLLAGCEDETLQGGIADGPSTEATETTEVTTQEETQPQEQTMYFLKEQIYYNPEGIEMARLTVTLNEDGMPESIFMDSGTDVTHTIYYDDQGVITGTKQVQELYGEKTVHISEYNDQGERTKITLNQGTDTEEVQESSYVYDSEGLIIQKDDTKNGKFVSSEKIEYDEHGNVTVVYTQQETTSSTATYTHTYENGLLVKTQRFTESDDTPGAVDQVITYTYDEAGRMIEKNIDGNQIYAFTYGKNGSIEKMVVTQGRYMSVCEYNEQGNFKVQYTYVDGEITGKIIYVWEAFSSQATDAQLKILDLIGIVIPNFATV